jgi:1,4-dihydroxy-2-naphthoate octaprenyltransferase
MIFREPDPLPPTLPPPWAVLWAFVRLGRPQFLVGGFLLYGLGAAVALLGGGSFSPGRYWLGQAAVTAIQLMTHYANDFFDVDADRANLTPTRWSGGSRVISSGALGETVARNAARALLALAALAIGAVARWGGERAGAGATALCAALALAWTYSAPPVRLHSRGLGEVTTAAVVTGLVPLVAFLLQQPGAGGRGDLARLGLALVPLMGLQFGMLLAIEFPDAAGDAAVGKRTLVVRLGARRAGAVYRALLIAIYGSIPLLALGGLPPLAAMAAALPAPIAAWQFHRLGTGAWGDPRAWEHVAFRAVVMLVATSAAELSAFVWLGHRL